MPSCFIRKEQDTLLSRTIALKMDFLNTVVIVTCRVWRSRGEMYIDHARLQCVCLRVCLSLAAFPHYCTDPDVTCGMVGVPSSCALLRGFASVHGFRCYHNTAPNAKYQRVLVLALCLVITITSHNRASRDCGSTANTTIYPKGYAQSKCVSYIVTMRAGDG